MLIAIQFNCVGSAIQLCQLGSVLDSRVSSQKCGAYNSNKLRGDSRADVLEFSQRSSRIGIYFR